MPYKVDVPNLVFDLKYTPIFEWYMVGCKFRNEFHEDMCWKEVEVRARILFTALNITVNITWGEEDAI